MLVPQDYLRHGHVKKISMGKKEKLQKEISILSSQLIAKKNELKELKENECNHDWWYMSGPNGSEWNQCGKCSKIRII